MLAGVARGEKGIGSGGGQERLPDVDTGRLSGLNYKLVCHFELAQDLVREFVNDTY